MLLLGTQFHVGASEGTTPVAGRCDSRASRRLANAANSPVGWAARGDSRHTCPMTSEDDPARDNAKTLLTVVLVLGPFRAVRPAGRR